MRERWILKKHQLTNLYKICSIIESLFLSRSGCQSNLLAMHSSFFSMWVGANTFVVACFLSSFLSSFQVLVVCLFVEFSINFKSASCLWIKSESSILRFKWTFRWMTPSKALDWIRCNLWYLQLVMALALVPRSFHGSICRYRKHQTSDGLGACIISSIRLWLWLVSLWRLQLCRAFDVWHWSTLWQGYCSSCQFMSAQYAKLHQECRNIDKCMQRYHNIWREHPGIWNWNLTGPRAFQEPNQKLKLYHT